MLKEIIKHEKFNVTYDTSKNNKVFLKNYNKTIVYRCIFVTNQATCLYKFLFNGKTVTYSKEEKFNTS